MHLPSSHGSLTTYWDTSTGVCVGGAWRNFGLLYVCHCENKSPHCFPESTIKPMSDKLSSYIFRSHIWSILLSFMTMAGEWKYVSQISYNMKKQLDALGWSNEKHAFKESCRQ